MYIKKITKTESLIKPPVSQRIKSGLVILQKGEEVGSHITDKREEVIIILQGEATITIENEKQKVKKDNLIYIPENKKHNIINQSNDILKYIYIVTLLN